MVAIPPRLDAIDAVWLQTALKEAGHEVPAARAVSYEPMPGAVGILGEVGVLSVDWDGASAIPSRLLVKCALDDDIARLYNSIMLFYQRELGFYRDLADKVPLRVPRGWVCLDDADRHLLVTDFVDGARPGDVVEGADLDTMRNLIVGMAGLHGRYWQDEQVASLPWMVSWRTESILQGAPIMEMFWRQAVTNEPELVPRDIAAVCEAYHVGHSAELLDRMAQRPWTFIHGDYQLDNMLFDADGVVAVDWQGCMVSFPGMDLGYLLGTSGSDETVAHEEALLDLYRDELRKAGGPSWSREELLDDLAWSMLYYVPGELIPYQQDYSAMGDQQGRLEQRFTKCAHDCIAAAVRWDMPGRIREAIGS